MTVTFMIDEPIKRRSDLFFLHVYGSWGSEIHTTKTTLEEAEEEARSASIKNPRYEYEVSVEPGGFNNPVYKNGVKISG